MPTGISDIVTMGGPKPPFLVIMLRNANTIMENNHVLMNERRLSGIVIEKQQGMEVLGAYLFPSVSVKDQFAVHPHVMLNACLALSWLDKLFRP
jgi:hypothetical protein